MRFIALLTIALLCWPAMASADTIILINGYSIQGKASAHPVFEKTHTMVKFSNGGHVTLRNSEIEQILPNNNDQFNNRKVEGAEG